MYMKDDFQVINLQCSLWDFSKHKLNLAKKNDGYDFVSEFLVKN